jgi:hypothetical protein
MTPRLPIFPHSAVNVAQVQIHQMLVQLVDGQRRILALIHGQPQSRLQPSAGSRMKSQRRKKLSVRRIIVRATSGLVVGERELRPSRQGEHQNEKGNDDDRHEAYRGAAKSVKRLVGAPSLDKLEALECGSLLPLSSVESLSRASLLAPTFTGLIANVYHSNVWTTAASCPDGIRQGLKAAANCCTPKVAQCSSPVSCIRPCRLASGVEYRPSG